MSTWNPLSRWLIPNHYRNCQLRKEQGFSLCIIEFDDQGELWDPRQLDNVLTHIQTICAGSQGGTVGKESGEVIVITFVHGWMHNGAPEDKNFDLFRLLIETRAEKEKEFARKNRFQPRPIIGVYLAWRGLLWDIPIAKYLTFWNRKTTALRVGHLSCTEVIHRIIRVVKSRNDKSKCMFIGHSFGGLILENAIVQALLGAIFEKKAGPLDSSTEIDSPTDLIVLINPACEAIIAKQFIDILKRNKIRVKKQETGIALPLLVSITSVADWSTKFIFPLGQFFVNALKSFRKYDNAHGRLRSQRYLCDHTAGHVTHLHNFKVQRTSGSHKAKLVFSCNNEKDEYEIVSQVPARTDSASSTSPSTTGEVEDDNCEPFWLMQVPKEIVPNHSEIFTDAFANMLTAFIDLSATSTKTTRIECKMDCAPLTREKADI